MFAESSDSCDSPDSFVPKVDFSDLYIYKKRVPRTQIEYMETRRMGDSQHTREELAHNLKLDSMVRKYVPPPEVVHNFFETKEKITEKQAAIMNESVDNYLNQLKQTLPPLQQRIEPRFINESEVPIGFSLNAKPQRKSVKRMFDRIGYYKTKQTRLKSILPDIYITQQLKEFVRTSDQRMPQILLDADISPPPECSKTPRKNFNAKRMTPKYPKTSRV